MKTISINVQEPYLGFLLAGTKTVEGRLRTGKFASVEVGDRFEITPHGTCLEVIGLFVYPTFRQMLEAEGVVAVLPDKTNIDEAEAVYYRFYTPENERQYGVIAFRLSPVL
jgi:ASC-1-like (ASCH) protein